MARLKRPTSSADQAVPAKKAATRSRYASYEDESDVESNATPSSPPIRSSSRQAAAAAKAAITKCLKSDQSHASSSNRGNSRRRTAATRSKRLSVIAASPPAPVATAAPSHRATAEQTRVADEARKKEEEEKEAETRRRRMVETALVEQERRLREAEQEKRRKKELEERQRKELEERQRKELHENQRKELEELKKQAQRDKERRELLEQHKKRQNQFDQRLAVYMDELNKLTPRRPTDLEMGARKLRGIRTLIAGMEADVQRDAGSGVDMGTMKLVLRDAKSEEAQLQTEIFLMEDEAKEREKRRLERLKEEEETMKRVEDERREKERIEASMIDKECKICFAEEMVDGVGCVPCGNMLGCKACVTKWVESNPTCPFCRHRYTNIDRQIKSKATMPKRNRLALTPRRSGRFQNVAASSSSNTVSARPSLDMV